MPMLRPIRLTKPPNDPGYGPDPDKDGLVYFEYATLAL